MEEHNKKAYQKAFERACLNAALEAWDDRKLAEELSYQLLSIGEIRLEDFEQNSELLSRNGKIINQMRNQVASKIISWYKVLLDRGDISPE